MGWGSRWGADWAGGVEETPPSPIITIPNFRRLKKAVAKTTKFLTGVVSLARTTISDSSNIKVSVVHASEGLDPMNTASPFEFNPDTYIKLIKSRGMPVTWSKAMLCPSRINSPAPGEHDLNCTLCDGSGFIYVDPIDTVMTVQGASLEQSYYIQGRFDSGVVTVTSLPDDKISYWDRVVLTKSSIRYSDLVRRRADSVVDPLRYAMLDILHVQSGSKVFTKGKDFRLENDQLVWTKNKNARPDDGVEYSIMCIRHPVYIVLNLMNQHRDVPNLASPGEVSAMPLRATAKLDFLVKDEAREPVAVPSTSPFSK